MSDEAPTGLAGAPRVVLVDDHGLFRSGVRAELGTRVQVVGEAEDLVVDEFEMDQCHWNTDSAASGGAFECNVKIRYAHPGADATVYPLEGGKSRVRLHSPQRAVTPGQAAVCYLGDAVLGGGWIARSSGVRAPAGPELVAVG